MTDAIQPSNRPPIASSSSNPLRWLRDQRFLRIVGQVVYTAILVFLLAQVWNGITESLETSGLTPNFDFLQNRAGFEIGGSGDAYSPDDSYWQAFLVGLRNTLMVSAVGLAGATALGILGGVLLLSGNWLVKTITRVLVETLRNIPLLLVIYIMFFVVVLSLPPLRESLMLPGDGLLALSIRSVLSIVALLFVHFSTRRGDPAQRRFRLTVVIAVIVAVEALFWAGGRNTSIASLYGAGVDGSGFWLIMIVLGTLVLAAYTVRLPRPETPRALAVGIFAGAILYCFAIIPSGVLTLETTPAFFLNNRGFVFPSVQATGRFAEWMAFVAVGVGLGIFAFAYLKRITETTGKPFPRFAIAWGVLGLFTLIGWIIVAGEPLPSAVPVVRDGAVVTMAIPEARAADLLTPEDELAYATAPLQVTLPQRQGLRFSSGETLTPEYVALTLALIIYTAAFIAEIVRAGILAVPRGQLEASRALGFSNGQTLRMVILPQALRVIIPPMTNQYLNLMKNSSLAIAISFSDVYNVMNTVINQSGQTVTGIVIVMLTYLVLSLLISLVMNWINARFQIVTR